MKCARYHNILEAITFQTDTFFSLKSFGIPFHHLYSHKRKLLKFEKACKELTFTDILCQK